MHKAVMLMQSSNTKLLKNLSVYVYKCFQIRNETLLNPWSNFLFFHADSVIICIILRPSHVSRNKVTNLFETAKHKTYQSKIEEGKSDPRTICKLFKEFGINCKRNGCENKFGIKCDNNIITNESDLAELFINYFVNIASKLKEPIINSAFERLNNFVQS